MDLDADRRRRRDRRSYSPLGDRPLPPPPPVSKKQVRKRFVSQTFLCCLCKLLV